MNTAATQRYAYLDSLRFVAAALVLVQHLFETRPGSPMMALVRLGPGVAGVALFFLISGFVIPLSVGQRFDWRAFFVRRLFRIYPLYLAALALIFVLGAAGVLPRWADMAQASGWRWLANLALVQEMVGARPFLGVSWTLAIELIWYGLFAAALLVWRGRAASRLEAWACAGVVVLTLASLVHGARIPLGRPTMIYAAILGYQCYRWLTGALPGRQLAGVLLRFAAVTAAASYVAFGHFHHPTITLAQDLGPWALALGVFAAVVLTPLRGAGVLARGLLPRLGAISYSVYLLHPIVINATDLYVAAPWQVPVAIGGTLALAAVAHAFVEQPGVALGRRVAAAWFAAPAAARAPLAA